MFQEDVFKSRYKPLSSSQLSGDSIICFLKSSKTKRSFLFVFSSFSNGFTLNFINVNLNLFHLHFIILRTLCLLHQKQNYEF